MVPPNTAAASRPQKAAASIRYLGIDQAIPVSEPDKTILDISLAYRIPHLHECGGHGRCTTCRVRVIRGHEHLSPPEPVETAMREKRHWDHGIRLACQARVQGNVEIERLIWSSADVHKTQTELYPEGKAEERSIAILFCDLRDYTRIAANQVAFDMAFMLNLFYTELGDPILMNNGIIYQYIGDEIVGIFGTAGGSREKSCTDAIRAAMGMSYALERLNRQELSMLGVSLGIGIGIHYGKAFIGHLGHPQFRQFSVIGDPVNTASRIQSYTRPSNTQILISETVVSSVTADRFEFGKKFKPVLKGLGDQLELIELAGFKDMDMALELQASLHTLLKDQDGFAKRFYDKLFLRDAALRHLFRGSMAGQGKIMTHMLISIVYALSRPEFLKTGLEALGRNHLRYGVRPEHYPLAYEALMETILETLGDACTLKIQKAWSEALTLIIEGMKRGASMTSETTRNHYNSANTLPHHN